jgi:subtilisin family serine protease
MRPSFLCAAAGAVLSTSAFGADLGVTSVAAAKLRGDLVQAIRHADAAELIPIVIVLKAQADAMKIEAARNIRDKEVRRAQVIDLLEDVADDTQAEILALLREGQAAGSVGDRVTPLWIVNAITAQVTPALAGELAQRPEVWYLHHDKPIGHEVFPVEPEGGEGVLATIECGVNLMKAPDVWDLGYFGEGVVVGIIDTGLCVTHPDIVNQVWFNPGEIADNGVDDDANGFVDDVNGWNFQFNNNNISDGNGHGTHVAGTVAGDGTNGEQTGMAPDAHVMVLEFWNDFAGESTVWAAHQYAMDNGANVLSASLGWYHALNPDRTMWRMVCENTFAAGIVTVYAAGNGGNCCGIDLVATPADVPDMITVGATNCGDEIAGFSSAGPTTWQDVDPYFDWPFPPGKMKPTISAPGDDTVSLSNNCSGYTKKSGTSMATPHVSGAVALVLSANPTLDHYDVKQIFKDTAVDLGTPGHDNLYGAGRVDVLAAVEAALDMATCPGDFNADGLLDVLDFVDFQTAWKAADPNADYDGDGDFTVLDFVAFQDAFVKGCP